MDVSRDITELYKIALAGGGVALLLAWPYLAHTYARQRVRFQALVVLVLLALGNYARWGFDAATTRLDAYDLLHYYVNAKYFDELGYFDLYPAVMLVDVENHGPFFRQGPTYMAQDEAGHHLEPVDAGVARGREVRERFTPERWSQFAHDVLYLQRTVGCSVRGKSKRCVRELDDALWNQLINDHGFNGTPVWTMVARPLTSVPIEHVKLLGYLDVVLVVGALGLVAWAYGGTTALWTALFLLVTYSTRWPYFTWVLLRYDWLALLIGATALLKRGHPLIAGLFAGLSSTLRLFPALWMWGPMWKGLFGLARREVNRPLLVLAAGFVLAVAVAEGGAVLTYGGGVITEHVENMADHNRAEQLSSRRVGFALALVSEPWQGLGSEPIISAARKERIDREQYARFAAALVGMLALGWAVRRRGDDEAFAYGFLPFFAFTTASYYYYVARAPLVVIHAANLDRTRDRACLALLFGIEVCSNAATSIAPEHRLFLIGSLAWDLVFYGLVAVGWMLVEPSPDRATEGR